MRKLVYYIILMITVVVIMPSIIVTGCKLMSDEILKKSSSSLDLKLYMHKENKIKKIHLEDYVREVVAAEMPAEFESEALKAQAVAARTYVYGRMKGVYKSKDNKHQGADICTDFAHCQAWLSKDDAIKKWSSATALKNWDKIDKAVSATNGVIAYFNGGRYKSSVPCQQWWKNQKMWKYVWTVDKHNFLFRDVL